MQTTDHRPVMSRRTQAEIYGIGLAIGILVGVLTADVILGVIAGAGFIACSILIIRGWSGRGGRPLSHP